MSFDPFKVSKGLMFLSVAAHAFRPTPVTHAVSRAMLDLHLKLLLEKFPPKPPPAPPAPVVPVQDELDGLGLRADCSYDDLARAYRRAAAIAHPDTGGSHEAMIALHEAVARIKRWKGWG